MDSLFVLKGIVVDGKKRGKKMGFPTANVKVDKITPQGIYLSEVLLEDKAYPSITFIGTADTFNETDFVAEAYILNFDQDIYGKEIAVKILKKLRDNQKFESVDALIIQMKEDRKLAEDFFKELEHSK